MQREITFKEKKYLLIEGPIGGGPIATKEQYRNGEIPFAHLCPDGKIRQFGKVIGTKKDIKIGKISKVMPTEKAKRKLYCWLANLLSGNL